MPTTTTTTTTSSTTATATVPSGSAPSRLDDLRTVDQALARIARIARGRSAHRRRADRSGVHLSRPAISILAALRRAGPVRLSELARLTDLEPPLITREVRDLTAAGHARRTADPTDGRAAIVELTAAGREASEAYRAAADEILAETFASWSADDLRTLAGYLDRVAHEFAGRRPDPGDPGDPAG